MNEKKKERKILRFWERRKFRERKGHDDVVPAGGGFVFRSLYASLCQRGGVRARLKWRIPWKLVFSTKKLTPSAGVTFAASISPLFLTSRGCANTRCSDKGSLSFSFFPDKGIGSGIMLQPNMHCAVAVRRESTKARCVQRSSAPFQRFFRFMWRV